MSLVVTPPPGLSIRRTTAFTAGSFSAILSCSTKETTLDSLLPKRDSSASSVSTPRRSTIATLSAASPETVFSEYSANRGPRGMSMELNDMQPARARSARGDVERMGGLHLCGGQNRGILPGVYLLRRRAGFKIPKGAGA